MHKNAKFDEFLKMLMMTNIHFLEQKENQEKNCHLQEKYLYQQQEEGTILVQIWQLWLYLLANLLIMIWILFHYKVSTK